MVPSFAFCCIKTKKMFLIDTMPDFLWHPWGLLKTQAGNLFRFLFYFYFLVGGESRIFFIFIFFYTVTSFHIILFVLWRKKWIEKLGKNWWNFLHKSLRCVRYSVWNLCFYGWCFLEIIMRYFSCISILWLSPWC